MSGPATRRAVLPPAGRPSGPSSRPPDSRPPDSRPPAGPGRSAGRSPAPPHIPTAWDPVRFRAVGEAPAAAAAHERRTAESRPLPGTPAGPLPDPSDWAAAVARSATESLLGIRPVSQLTRWLSAPVYVALSRRAGLAARVAGKRRSTGVRVRSVTTWAVGEFVHEASVTLHDGSRFRAAALRLEKYHGRWMVTALEIG